MVVIFATVAFFALMPQFAKLEAVCRDELQESP